MGLVIYHFKAISLAILATLKKFKKTLSVEKNWFEFLKILIFQDQICRITIAYLGLIQAVKT